MSTKVPTAAGHSRAHDPVDRLLRGIERRVLGDVRMTPRLVGAGLIAATALAAAAVAHWYTTYGGWRLPQGHWLSVVTVVFFAGSTALSLIALQRRRFNWCCAAAYASGIAAVAGGGTFWWHRTAEHPASTVSITIGWAAATALAVIWLVVISTPIDKSQPEMRSATAGMR